MEYTLSNRISRYLEYFSNKRISIEGQLDNGLKTGIWTYFHDNGTLKARGLFIDDKRQGKWQWFNEDGVLTTKAMLKDDRFHGVCINYHENGTIQDILLYDKGEIKNVISRYDVAGNLIAMME